MDCPGCKAKIQKALQKLDGVNNIDIDMEMQKVTVMGYADQETVLKAVRRTGRRAELWPYGYSPEYTSFSFTQESYYYQQQPAYLLETQPSAPYGIQYHNLDGDDQQQQRRGYRASNSYYDDEDSYYRDYHQRRVVYSAVKQPAIAMFSDENPHACSIM
ncbi:unnamed protein product [Linum tenue]|uniref:HMA domain-containing protein n=1 Tax=Linum tenue TaxID=586396 RepID=A0AAV0MFI6_9ROSI|nr:unnamed protein product [Linum tenue]